MIDRIRDFFVERSGRADGGAAAHSSDEFNLAAASLLVHAASVDADFETIERQQILEILGRRFSLSKTEAESLLSAAETKAGNAVQILGFTRAVKDSFSYEERTGLMEMLWEVVLADGRLDELEDQLMRRIGGLIYVSDRDRGMAKRRAAERLRASSDQG